VSVLLLFAFVFYRYDIVPHYTVSQKRRHYTLVHIFAKYWPIDRRTR